MEYKVLEEKLQERGIRKTTIAKRLNISEKTLQNKLSKKTQFTWEQVCIIQNVFFPDITKDCLFKCDDVSNKAS